VNNITLEPIDLELEKQLPLQIQCIRAYYHSKKSQQRPSQELGQLNKKVRGKPDQLDEKRGDAKEDFLTP